MKNCKRINLLFGEVFSGELKGKQLQDFDNHLKECGACNTEYSEFKNTLNIMNKREHPEIKNEFWDNYWDKLSDKTFLDKPTLQSKLKNFISIRFVDHKKFAFPTAALVLILFGLFLGKMLFSPENVHILYKKDKIISNSFDNNFTYYTMVNNHIDDLRPVFSEYSNYQVSDANKEEFISIRRGLLKKLILQNYLLKRIADKNNDPQLTSLIEDLQLILLEIINSSSTENEKIDNVKNMLDGSDVIFKMNMLKKKNRFYNKKELGEMI